MAWDDVLKRLAQIPEILQQGTSGKGPVTGEDILLLQEGDLENRGLGNILRNFQRIGSKRRYAEKSLKEGDEDRQLKNEYLKAQTENLRSLGSYRMGQLNIAQEKNNIMRLREEIRKETNKDNLAMRAQEVANSKLKAEAAMKQADAAVQRATNDVDIAKAQREFDWAKLIYDIYDDMEKNEIARRNVEINQQNANTQSGYLGIATEKAPAETAQILSNVDRNTAEAAKTDAETGLLTSPTRKASDLFGSITAGQKAGVLTQSGGNKMFGVMGGPELTGVGERKPGPFERLNNIFSSTNEPAASPAPSAGKPIPKALVRDFLRRAGNNKALAKSLARRAGYDPDNVVE